jgi:hypothetical protein
MSYQNSTSVGLSSYQTDHNYYQQYKDQMEEFLFFPKNSTHGFIEGFQVGFNSIQHWPILGDYKFGQMDIHVTGIRYVSTKPLTSKMSRILNCGNLEIYDKYGNYVSNLTLPEYKILLRETKIDRLMF